jgi:CelD/BcsL family acetyltransferase involved in cellulose biosynthesis
MSASSSPLAGHSVPFSALSGDELSRWRALVADASQLQSPYFAPEFTAAVAAVRDDVRVAVLRRDGVACAFFPHQRRGGEAVPVAGTFNDFQAVIAAPDVAWSPRELLRATGARRLAFDHWVELQVGAELNASVQHFADSPYADLSAGFDAYLAAIAARSDQVVKLRQRQRKIAREHSPLQFTLRSRDPCALAQVISWKSLQFQRSGLPDPFAHAWPRALLERVLAADAPEFAGWLSTLHCGERLIAAHLGMRCHRTLHYWFPVYDHEFHQYGPGLLMLLEILRGAADAGIARVEFGKGDDAWKPRFATGVHRVAEGVLERDGLGRRVRAAGRGVVALLRRSPLRAVGRWPMRQLRRALQARRLR